MTDKHTPGPWFTFGSGVYANTPQNIDHRKYRGFMDIEEPAGGYLIAESTPHEPTSTLIAAAPDLLEALEQVADWLEIRIADIIQEDDKPANDARINLARAAIAKAKGEST